MYCTAFVADPISKATNFIKKWNYHSCEWYCNAPFDASSHHPPLYYRHTSHEPKPTYLSIIIILKRRYLQQKNWKPNLKFFIYLIEAPSIINPSTKTSSSFSSSHTRFFHIFTSAFASLWKLSCMCIGGERRRFIYTHTLSLSLFQWSLFVCARVVFSVSTFSTVGWCKWIN